MAGLEDVRLARPGDARPFRADLAHHCTLLTDVCGAERVRTLGDRQAPAETRAPRNPITFDTAGPLTPGRRGQQAACATGPAAVADPHGRSGGRRIPTRERPALLTVTRSGCAGSATASNRTGLGISRELAVTWSVTDRPGASRGR